MIHACWLILKLSFIPLFTDGHTTAVTPRPTPHVPGKCEAFHFPCTDHDYDYRLIFTSTHIYLWICFLLGDWMMKGSCMLLFPFSSPQQNS